MRFVQLNESYSLQTTNNVTMRKIGSLPQRGTKCQVSTIKNNEDIA